jgi:hypothetical protein
MTSTHVINRALLEEAISYGRFVEMMDAYVEAGATSGPNQSDSMAHYTKMNRTRMRRLNKTTKLITEMKTALDKVNKPQIWLVLVEAWCGDVAQNIPVVQKMAEYNPNITMKLIYRDEHLDVMDAYLTNGGRSIPKLIMLDAENLNEMGQWGPRPAPVQAMVVEFKETGGEYSKFSEKVQRWYNADGTETVQREFIKLLEKQLNN